MSKFLFIALLAPIVMLADCAVQRSETQNGSIIQCASKMEIDNSGKLQNALGYYGEGVLLGGKSIVGQWYHDKLNCCQNDEEYVDPVILYFNTNGTGTFTFFSEVGIATRSFVYGVSKDGLYLQIKGQNAPAENFYHIMAETDVCVNPIPYDHYAGIEESCFILNHNNEKLYKRDVK